MEREHLDRIERERAFHNQAHETDPRSPIRKYFEINAECDEYFLSRIREFCPGHSVLDYGCGDGRQSCMIAQAGARSIIGIDISDAAIDRATRLGIPNAQFFRMDAEQLEFPDSCFDVVLGVAILHHLNFSKALSEICRVLKKDGVAAFLEPLGHNPAINLYRRMTPSMRTKDEHPLLMSDIREMHRYFASVEFRPFNLTTLGCVYAKPLVGIARKMDRVLFKIPGLARFAWLAVLTLRNPQHESAGTPSPGEREA